MKSDSIMDIFLEAKAVKFVNDLDVGVKEILKNLSCRITEMMIQNCSQHSYFRKCSIMCCPNYSIGKTGE